MAKVVVTGANGFIGRGLCTALANDGHAVIGTVRAQDRIDTSTPHESVMVGNIDGGTDWRPHLNGADAVVHLAAQTASADNAASRPALRRVNVEGTETLARHTADAGVRRLVYVSSVKVLGERTHDRAFRADDPPAPGDDYARSKLEAEQALRRVAARDGLEIVVVRPPLVYGPGVKGNFRHLMQWVDRALPLPLASVDNRRSLIAVDNLVDFLMLCLHHPAAAGETFLVSDDEDLSTPELMRRMARALKRPLRLWPMPPRILRALAITVGRRDRFDKLCGSLQVDSSHARDRLGWQSKTSVDDALVRTIAWYRQERAARSGL